MASGFSVANDEHLLRTLWSKQIKQLLLDDLVAMRFVKLIQDFPDGTVINIPSIGEAETSDFAEGAAIRYGRLDTGNFQFSFDQYKYSAHAITEKFKRDSYYAADVIAAFAPREHRALMEAIEARIFNRMNAYQTSASTNAINGAAHRWIGSGTNESLALTDFAKARYALTKANVPLTNLVAVVDPSVAYTIQTHTNVVNLMSPQPEWDSFFRNGMVTGMKFAFNIYGFDTYISNYLPRLTTTETISGVTSSAGVANMFFSAAGGDLNPVVGGFRQHPTVYSEFNKDLQQTEYLTIAEYGFKVYRPENMVIVVTDTDIV